MNINWLVLSVSVLTAETELLVLLFFFAALFIFSSPVPGGPSGATAQTIRPYYNTLTKVVTLKSSKCTWFCSIFSKLWI